MLLKYWFVWWCLVILIINRRNDTVYLRKIRGLDGYFISDYFRKNVDLVCVFAACVYNLFLVLNARLRAFFIFAY